MAKITKEEALRYHAEGKPGKIEVVPTKPYSTQMDLSLAYSPGVAEPCLEIEKNPLDAYKYTSKGNLVAVISNGTAVLGLGDIGPLAGKPVMEGKGLLFKIFAGIDVFDIEVNEKDPDKFIETVKAIAPTFGGISHDRHRDAYGRSRHLRLVTFLFTSGKQDDGQSHHPYFNSSLHLSYFLILNYQFSFSQLPPNA